MLVVNNMQELVVLFGPTACGKSTRAVEIALERGGEIISADSRQIYRGLEIGTGKITLEEMRGVPHYWLDLIDPTEVYSAAKFAQYARTAIADIQSRGKLPILCGGTGLYINSVIYDLEVPSFDTDPTYQIELEKYRLAHGNQALWEKLHAVDPTYALEIHPNSYPYVMRGLEVFERTGKSKSAFRSVRTPKYTCEWVLPYTWDREQLYSQINTRVQGMFDTGWAEEVSKLLTIWVPRDAIAFNSLGYREALAVVDGNLSIHSAVEKVAQYSRNYAKRQITWQNRRTID
jgi:tRNA dimethylallyltransferase